MATNSITITSTDKLDFDAYVARPKSGSGPVVVVIQEIFGVNQWLREVADFVAEQGFIAVAPDLFHRQEKGIQLTDKTEAEWKRAFELYQGFDEHKGVADLGATVNAARKMEGSNGKVGCMGFCLGGKLAYLMAVHSDADANVGYYGVGIEKSLNEPPRKPLLLHIAEADKFVPPDAQEVIKKALEVNDCVTIHSYPGKDHAFCRVGGEHYDKAACDTAHKRTVEFFKTHLG
jgi:carboxymethylenebutenolidase